MLVLARRINERIQIGDNVEITVCRIGKGQVRLGISAPIDVAIKRSELATKLNHHFVTASSATEPCIGCQVH